MWSNKAIEKEMSLWLVQVTTKFDKKSIITTIYGKCFHFLCDNIVLIKENQMKNKSTQNMTIVIGQQNTKDKEAEEDIEIGNCSPEDPIGRI